MKMNFKQKNIKLAIAASMLVSSVSLSTAGYAATATDNLVVTTSVAMSCTVEAAALNFQTYNPTASAHTDASADITSTCTHGGSAKITLGQGAVAAAGSTDAAPLRQMINGTDSTKLRYDLYQNEARDVVFGNTTGTGKGFTASTGANTTTVYGRITAGLTASVGSYADSVLVTLTY